MLSLCNVPSYVSYRKSLLLGVLTNLTAKKKFRLLFFVLYLYLEEPICLYITDLIIGTGAVAIFVVIKLVLVLYRHNKRQQRETILRMVSLTFSTLLL